MTVPLLQLSSQVARAHARGLLLTILEKEEILVRVIVGKNGRLTTQSQKWSEYWEPVFAIGNPHFLEALDSLHRVWSHYIHSGFDSGLRSDFCFRYFSLLEELLQEWKLHTQSQWLRKALHCVLGLECFGIFVAGSPGEMLAAGTSSLRNPCYLLAKLGQHGSYDDCQFLPLITVAGGEGSHQFYHYRQHRLSADSNHSLFLYLSASQKTRQKSYQIINELEHQIGKAIDPRAIGHAERIAKKIVIPYLQAHLKDSNQSTFNFELLDLGAGRGVLAAYLCREVRGFLQERGFQPRFRVWMVDLSLSKPSRFFAGDQLSRASDSLVFFGDDYRNWLSQESRLPPANGLRIGLVSRSLDSLSDFQIEAFSPAAVMEKITPNSTNLDWKKCLPSYCLNPDHPEPHSLQVSNSKIWLDSGQSFAQVSLSPYFHGLHLLSCPAAEGVSLGESKDRIFLPLRSFQANYLLAKDGKSILERLLGDCSMAIILDTAMRPQDLKAHRDLVRLPDIVAIDMTKTLGLVKYQSYVLLRPDDPGLKSLAGERLW